MCSVRKSVAEAVEWNCSLPTRISKARFSTVIFLESLLLSQIRACRWSERASERIPVRQEGHYADTREIEGPQMKDVPFVVMSKTYMQRFLPI